MVDWSFALKIILFGVILVFVILIALAVIMRLIEKFFGGDSSQQQTNDKKIKQILKTETPLYFSCSVEKALTCVNQLEI